jgi:hypothetical protein
LFVLVLELADRACSRAHAGRGDRFQKRVDDGLLQPPAAERLAAGVGVVQHVPANAEIPPHLAAGPGIADLHPPSALPAADQPLEQG